MRNGSNGAGFSARAKASQPAAPVHLRERAPRPELESAVRMLLQAVGEDPGREGLRDTPQRFVRALLEFTQGYDEDPKEILGRVFHEAHEGMVLVQDIPFVSLCEHHLLPVEGKASVAYLPDGKVVGLSKLGRIVQTFARRLQMQERMTDQIANAIQEHLQPRGVAVRIRAQHACMALRGVRTPAPMTTSCYLGELGASDRRAEFNQLSR